MADAIERGEADGSIPSAAPTRLLVESAAALLDGMQQQWMLEPDRISMVNNVRAHVETFKQSWA
ncbi:hypothetical protein [Microbacterium profundi]|uniref:hypothetical protein n=1 Tax=Microbacterium profundi TaxID=450380 RepID=UPI00051A60CF|nr:hypothetical protein [Microbacterium profundi]